LVEFVRCSLLEIPDVKNVPDFKGGDSGCRDRVQQGGEAAEADVAEQGRIN
jgi:hypothetical protein